LITWNVLHASSVASGRWSNSGGGLLDIFCDGLRDSFSAMPFSGVDALSADFASSSDMLDAGESILSPFGAGESPMSSFFNLTPLGFGRSSSPGPAIVSGARLLPSMTAKRCAQSAD
jgi:hypothetical protein